MDYHGILEKILRLVDGILSSVASVSRLVALPDIFLRMLDRLVTIRSMADWVLSVMAIPLSLKEVVTGSQNPPQIRASALTRVFMQGRSQCHENEKRITDKWLTRSDRCCRCAQTFQRGTDGRHKLSPRSSWCTIGVCSDCAFIMQVEGIG